MSPGILIFVVAVLLVAGVKYLNHTDLPKIKNLVEIPGVPLFGSLLQLGASHADACRKLAAQYGPIFQARLGNRVRIARKWICFLWIFWAKGMNRSGLSMSTASKISKTCGSGTISP